MAKVVVDACRNNAHAHYDSTIVPNLIHNIPFIDHMHTGNVQYCRIMFP